MINKNGEHKQLLEVKNFMCRECQGELFMPVGYARVIHLKEKKNKHYTYERIGIKLW